MGNINKPCFSNGTEYDDWLSRNCCRCIKSPKEHWDEDGMTWFSKSRCKIYDEIQNQCFGYGNEPVSENTHNAAKLLDCPYRKEHWDKKVKKDKDKSQNLF